MKNWILVLGFCLALACLGAAEASAATRNVPADYPTIQTAINASSNGDVIRVAPGTYVEDIGVTSLDVTIESSGGATATTLRGTGLYGNSVIFISGGTVTVRGLTVTGGRANWGGGVVAYGGGTITITDCVFEDNKAGYGYMGAAIVGWGPLFYIERNTFRNNDLYGDRQWLAGVITFVNGGRGYILNNVFVDNNTRAVNLYTASAPTVVENNTMVGNDGGLYYPFNQTPEWMAIRNNIIVGNNLGVEGYDDPIGLTTFENNLVWGNGTDFFHATVMTGTNGNLSVEPKFVDRAGRVLRLLPGSPAVDAGTSLGAPADDRDRRARPADGDGDGQAAVDIGAYELSASVEQSGTDTAAVYSGSTGFFLRNSHMEGPGDAAFGYGPQGLGWIPLAGDWDGDGIDTVGLYDPLNGAFFLKNTNAPGPADVVFVFGRPNVGWVPLSGDWDGDGRDGVGLYVPDTGFFLLRNELAPGPADLEFMFGPAAAGWVPLAGDWDGDGVDTVGLYAPVTSFFFLRNTHAAGSAELAYAFGPAGAGWTPVAGDFDGNGVDTVGLHSPTTGYFFLRNLHEAGVADLVFNYGPPGVTPLMGDWDAN